MFVNLVTCHHECWAGDLLTAVHIHWPEMIENLNFTFHNVLKSIRLTMEWLTTIFDNVICFTSVSHIMSMADHSKNGTSPLQQIRIAESVMALTRSAQLLTVVTGCKHYCCCYYYYCCCYCLIPNPSLSCTLPGSSRSPADPQGTAPWVDPTQRRTCGEKIYFYVNAQNYLELRYRCEERHKI